MKKLTTFFLMAVASYGVSAQCIIDANNTDPIAPPLDSIPCIERGVAYGPEVVQISIPSSLSIATVDSIVITSVDGFPTGITWELNPASGVILGGENACAEITGTTNDTTGRYNLVLNGTAYVKIAGVPNTFALNQPPVSDEFVIYLDVIESGASCRGVITSVANKTNAVELSVYPNPTNGVFNLTVNAGNSGAVEVSVFDFTGRTVYTESTTVQNQYNTKVDISNLPKGIYAVRVKTTEGVATKNVLVN